MQAEWPLARRIGFRFVFSYLALYMLPAPIGWVPIPKTEWIAEAWQSMWDAAVPWFGEHVLGMAPFERAMDTGSGDTTFDYAKVALVVVLAAIATVAWSALDRRRTAYPRLARGLRVYVRYYLAVTLIAYGLAKLFKVQFPTPDVGKLSERVGDQTPMSLLWTFMGHSYGYSLFTGIGECLGGALLFWRRTTLAGALIVLGVMLHVLVLNLCYDVPVKLFSFHLIAMALVLIAPDARRLFTVVVLGHATPALPPREPLPWRRIERARPWVKHVAIAAVVYWQVGEVRDAARQWGDDAPPPPSCAQWCGLWEVEVWGPAWAPTPPTLDERKRPRLVAIGRFGLWQLRLMDDTTQVYAAAVGDDGASVELRRRGNASAMRYRVLDAGERIEVTGALDLVPVRIVLRRRHDRWELLDRGFHWVNEFPYNK
jgi:hypothetical protein